MRVSSDKDDAGYPQFCAAQANGKKIFVYLNGEEVKHCTVADNDRGFVERCVLDAEGNIQVDPVDDNQIWMQRVTGMVEVRFE